MTTKRKKRDRIRRRIKTAPPDHAPQIARINEITSTSKTIWFSLLSYLAFVSVTCMGVEDKDFFVTQGQTELPLVGVSVPTLLFFALAPSLGALIYAHFHMHLLKLWEQLTDAPSEIAKAPLSDHIAPWLVSDLCLSFREKALRKRPLAFWSKWLSVFFVFLGTPTVLAVMWWRSATPHYDFLTIGLCGVPLIFSLFFGLSSWHRLRQLTRAAPARAPGLRLWQLALFTITALLITTVGWLRVEGTFRYYAQARGYDVTGSALDWEANFLLATSRFVGVNFSQVPANWKDEDTFKRDYRTIWCAKVGLSPIECGGTNAPKNKDAYSIGLRRAREQFCVQRGISKEFDRVCQGLFDEYEERFEADWHAQRLLSLASLHRFDFRGKDLRKSYMRDEKLHRARFDWAKLQRADLGRAKLQRASFFEARLEGARLFEASLQGTSFKKTKLYGVDFVGAKFDSTTSFEDAELAGVAIRRVNLKDVPDIFDSIDKIFGDSTVVLPEEPTNIETRERFEREYATDEEFYRAWQKWQRSVGQDPENPKEFP